MSEAPASYPEPARDYEVPVGATPARCPTCDAPFRRAADCLLHRAQVHDAGGAGAALSSEERETLAAARDREETALRRFRLKALGAVVLLYFLLLMTYALV